MGLILVKVNNDKNITIQIANGAFSGFKELVASSGPDVSAVRNGTNVTISATCNPSGLNIDPQNFSFNALLQVDYDRNGYGGYIGECGGVCRNGVFSYWDTTTQAVGTSMPFHVVAVGAVGSVNAFDSNGFVDVSENLEFYEDNNNDWIEFRTSEVAATEEQVENLPSGVTFNGWLGGDSTNGVIIGSDGNYYTTDGNIAFSNLPSGVIVTYTDCDGVFAGSDGNYYDLDGNQVLENLPSGVTPVSSPFTDVIYASDGDYYNYDGYEVFENLPSGVTPSSNPANDCYMGSDGKYYNIDGDEILQDLPQGVTITGDDGLGNYVGSDGKIYDVNGYEVVACNGTLLNYSNRVRLTIDGVDIFGNQVNIGGDITLGQQSINIDTWAGIKFLKYINFISCRNMDNNVSIGNGQLKIRGLVTGVRLGVDETPPFVDPDLYLGNFNICTCVFNVCKKYADIVVNDDMPLGMTGLSITEIGYLVLNEDISLEWEGFDEIPVSAFPYCCESLDTSINNSGSIGSNRIGEDTVDLSCVCDGLDLIASKLDYLSCLCDKLDLIATRIGSLVVSPVVNNTVTPCQPVVEVQTVTVPAPVVNNTVTPCQPEITVLPCQPTISVDGTDLTGLIDEIHRCFFKSVGDDCEKSITDYIQELVDKDCAPFIDVTISPYDLVNIRRVFRDTDE